MSFITDVKNELGKLDQSRATLLKFGITMAVVLSVIAGFVFFRGSVPERAFVLWGIAALFLFLGLLIPVGLKPIHKVWMGLAFVMGWFMSRILLSLVFYLTITPVGLIMKLGSKDLLNEKIDKDAKSYWIKREKVEVKPERYKKLF